MSAEPLIALVGATCRYATEDVVEDVDLEIAAGEFVGVVGPSGSGKTTLLRAIAGSMQPVAGSVTRRRG
ncbi:MAG: ATP-binding cassette domain-containing protein, partial [Solirubrobacterales bacterium]|nr:ATP-binding cassette domain-containing protein [Solirubrobacterales bacterium]